MQIPGRSDLWCFSGSEILAFLKKLKERELLSATDTYLFLDYLEDFSSELKDTHIDSDSVNRNEVNKLYFEPLGLLLLQ